MNPQLNACLARDYRTLHAPLRAVVGAEARVVDPQPESADAANSAAEVGFDPGKPIALYIAEDRGLRDHVRDVLASDLNVFFAVGPDGLEKARRYGPDVVVTEEMTPRSRGRDLLRRLREDPELGSIPILCVTALSGTEGLSENFAAGADDFIRKPFHEEELRARVQNLVRARRQRTRLAELNAALEARVEAQVAELSQMARLLAAGAKPGAILPGSATFELVRDHARRADPAPAGRLFRREGEYWTIASGGTVLRLRDSKGLAYLAHLLAHPNRDVHACDLVNGSAVGAEIDHGDSGPRLDDRAKASYRERLRDLREELEEARQCNDTGRLERMEAEAEALTHELAAAVGLGGRDRRNSAATERARVNVTRNIKGAIEKIVEASADLGRHLIASVRTGAFCVYDPPRGTDAWQVSAAR